MGNNEMWGFLRDSGYSAMAVGRLERIFEVTKLPMEQFVNLTDGQLSSTYNKYLNPTGSKGLGKNTLEAFAKLRGRFRQMTATEKRAEAAEAADRTAVVEAATERMKGELLQRQFDLKLMGEVVAGLSTMLESCDLSMILSIYDRKAAK